MSPHDLDDEGPGVRIRRGIDVINSFTNTLKSSGRSDGEVCHRHVVVDRPDQANDLEVGMGLGLFFCDPP